MLKPFSNFIGTQFRNRSYGYPGFYMIRDIRRRELIRRFYPERYRLRAIRFNRVLPQVMRDDARDKMENVPWPNNPFVARDRCVLTSRWRSILLEYRISRLSFRNLADYNHLSGVIQARWKNPTENAIMKVAKSK
ncbi:hypothetical protein ACOME3_003944 [Neoechinorhynchus agilis]